MSLIIYLVKQRLPFLTIFLLLIKKNPSAYPTSTCPERRYLYNGICCNMCQPGFKVESHCKVTPDDGSCMPCPVGFYSSEWTGSTDCIQINPCNMSHEHVEVPARPDGTTDNQCACDSGYQYSGSWEICLQKDSRNEPTSQASTPFPVVAFSTSPPHPPSYDIDKEGNSSSNAAIYGLAGTLSCVAICVLVGFIVWRRKRHGRRETNVDLRTAALHTDENTDDKEEKEAMMLEEDEGHGTGTSSSRRSTGESSQNVGGMAEEDVEILREVKPEFVERLPINRVLDRMSKIFNREDEANIKAVPSEYDKRRRLLDILMEKDSNAFSTFVKVLEDVDRSLAKILKEEKKKRRQTKKVQSHGDYAAVETNEQ